MKRKPKERESFKLSRLLAREISAQSFAPPPPPAYVSDLFVTPPRPFCAFCIYHPVVKVSLFQQYKQGGLQILDRIGFWQEKRVQMVQIYRYYLFVSFICFLERSEASFLFNQFVFVWKNWNIQIETKVKNLKTPAPRENNECSRQN